MIHLLMPDKEIDTPPQLRHGNVAVRAIATFDLSVPGSGTDEQIQKKLYKMMGSAGITSLSAVVIERD